VRDDVYCCENDNDWWFLKPHEVEKVETLSSNSSCIKPGDKVKVLSNINQHHFNIGEIVTIRFACDDGDYYCENNNGSRWFLKPREVEKVENLSSNSSGIKVGDKVRVLLNESDHHFNIGEVVTVVTACDESCYCRNDHDGWYLKPHEFEKVEDSEIKPGDKVRVCLNTSDHGFDVGEIVIMTFVYNDGDFNCMDYTGDEWRLKPHEVEKVE
jgi:hypothetical protein